MLIVGVVALVVIVVVWTAAEKVLGRGIGELFDWVGRLFRSSKPTPSAGGRSRFVQRDSEN